MSFKSLIAHNGVVHQKSNSVEQPKPNSDSKTVAPKSNSSSKKQVVETPENQTENSTTTEIQTTQNLTSATLFTGFGESIFTLLIASPFLLFGLKKWLHK